jgi:UDP-N-acetylmuramoyl-L-alanyl-D-glutamate--2,6-diaminopimelate ligase
LLLEMSTSANLYDLLHRAGLPANPELAAHHTGGVTADSRQIENGMLFVACPGATHDGHRYIPDAIAKGAVAVVGSSPDPDLAIPYIQVPDSRAALARLAAAFHDFPARKLTMIGVTGTDGKTTTANLIYHVLASNGVQTGLISTVNALIGDRTLDTGFHVTTPDAPDIQAYLAQMVGAGLSHAILEATSHGLEQRRVDGCEIDVAVVTNITHEHLDYHGSYEAYRAAKGRLFTFLDETVAKPQGNPHLAVLNRDDQSYEYLAGIAGRHQVSYGLYPEADLRATEIVNLPDGLRFGVLGAGFQVPVVTSLVGDYNVSNCLAALAVGIYAHGLTPEQAAQGIATLRGIPGRMQRIDLGQDFLAIVDFAHTPNALLKALTTARAITAGRLLAVFGSAGLRDRAKRRMMAEVSAELADLSVLTAEDPRTESLETILEEMATGAEARGAVRGKDFVTIPDRGQAIRYAVAAAQPGDTVIVCGKGHEQSMCFGVVEYPWDDATALRAALAELLGVSGPEMPYLPTSGS